MQAKNLNEEVSKRVPKKKPRLRAEEKNQIKLESIFDCSSEECPTYMLQQDKNLNSEVEDETVAAEYTKETIKDLNKVGVGRGSIETPGEHSLRTKMNSLMNMIKSRYEEEVKMVDFKRRGTDELDLKKSEYSNSEDGHFRSIDRTSFLMRNIDACVKDPAHVKKLNWRKHSVGTEESLPTAFRIILLILIERSAWMYNLLIHCIYTFVTFYF